MSRHRFWDATWAFEDDHPERSGEQLGVVDAGSDRDHHEPAEDVYELTTALERAPDTPGYVELGFAEGLPRSASTVKRCRS